jgi:UPF0755 protein
MRERRNRRRASRGNRAALFILLIAALGAFVLLGAFLFLFFSDAAAGDLGPGAENLNPAERFLLLTYLSTHAADLTAPGGADPTPITFSVRSGETSAQIATHLAEQKLVSDSALLNYYLRYQGLDQHIEAGDFILRRTMTIPEIAKALTNASAREISVRLVEGWRLEQIADALSTDTRLSVSREELLELAGPSPEPGKAQSGYSFSDDLPAGASLEGFLFPDTYLFKPGASAAEALKKMLTTFEARLPADYTSAIAEHGLTLYQAVIVASLVEREAVVDEERPIIASVILNRLAAGQWLEIDATVQYALGAPGDWWPRVDGLDLRTIANPYNTYAFAGLPPGPIANPGLASLLAAAHPADTTYLFYRAQCDGSGRHTFAATYEQHLANACF